MATRACVDCGASMAGRATTSTRCKPCQDRASLSKKLWLEFGITVSEYEALVVIQDGFCAIDGCEREPECVDHCHITGHVRGLLCNKHNKALGSFGDDVGGLLSAVSYLQGCYA